MTNVLEAGISNPNPLVHCAPTLLNIGRIERVDDFALFHEGFSDSVIKVVIAVGKEREKIFDATIHFASVINGVDYWAEGRTAESLRIGHMSVAELNDYLHNGA